jgi:hypothetical protein
MTFVPTAPPAAHQPWRTRGELLAARAEAVPQLERRLFSLRRLAVQVLLVLAAGLAALVAGVALDSDDRSVGIVLAVLVSVPGAVAVVIGARRAVRTRELIGQLLSWEDVERAGRSLPAGDVRPDLRTPHDARDDADFEQVAEIVAGRVYTRPWGMRLLVRSGIAGAGIILGAVLVLAIAAGERDGFALGALVGGGVVLISSLLLAAGATRLGFRMSRLSSALEADIRALRVARIGAEAAQEVHRTWVRKRAAVLAPAALLFLSLFVVRLAQVSDAARAVTVVVVVALVLVGAVVLLVRRSR